MKIHTLTNVRLYNISVVTSWPSERSFALWIISYLVYVLYSDLSNIHKKLQKPIQPFLEKFCYKLWQDGMGTYKRLNYFIFVDVLEKTTLCFVDASFIINLVTSPSVGN